MDQGKLKPSLTSRESVNREKSTTKRRLEDKAHSKSSSTASEYKSHSDYKTLGDNNSSRYSFQGSGSNSRPYKDLPTHPLENEVVEKHYAILTLSILKSLFNKDCDCEKPSLIFFKVKSRPTVARCSSCHKQVSITSNTPLHKFQLPLGYFSYILHDAILQYPKVITSTEISRKLNLPYKTAYFLKRRLQVITSMLNTKLRENLRLELTKYAEKHPITLPKGEDLKPLLENYPIASADAVVLYSSSVKANKYRSRRFRTGSSSIYKSNNLGGEQVGTLVHTIGVKGSYTFYKSIPLTKQEYLLDDLDTVIPRSIPLFTDEGYKFIWDRKNHRMVNHSKRSNDPRYNMSRERWVTKEGVSSNIAEGRNNILKQAFRSYYYVSPKWSQVYLDELSFLGNLRYNKDLARLFFTGSYVEGEEITCSGYTVNKHFSLKKSASLVKPSVNSSYPLN
ncbi:MAG: transposase [Leptospira sp.]|nr:transposase [Leptospira sp.]